MEVVAYIIIIAQIVLGIFYCFFGYKYFRLITAVIGFFVGSAIGFALLYSEGMMAAAIAAIVGGLLLALLAYFIYVVGLFFSGAFFGLVLSVLILRFFSADFSSWYSLEKHFGISASALQTPGVQG